MFSEAQWLLADNLSKMIDPHTIFVNLNLLGDELFTQAWKEGLNTKLLRLNSNSSYGRVVVSLSS